MCVPSYVCTLLNINQGSESLMVAQLQSFRDWWEIITIVGRGGGMLFIKGHPDSAQHQMWLSMFWKKRNGSIEQDERMKDCVEGKWQEHPFHLVQIRVSFWTWSWLVAPQPTKSARSHKKSFGIELWQKKESYSKSSRIIRCIQYSSIC